LKQEKEASYVYILECSDGSLYTGWTTDVEKRLAVHNAGKGAKYTKPRLPVKLVYVETVDSKSQGQQRECSIKKLKRPQKLELIGSSRNELDAVKTKSN
jgi:putative endonuclease